MCQTHQVIQSCSIQYKNDSRFNFLPQIQKAYTQCTIKFCHHENFARVMYIPVYSQLLLADVSQAHWQANLRPELIKDACVQLCTCMVLAKRPALHVYTFLLF